MSVGQDELDKLAEIMSALDAAPNNVALLQRQVDTMRSLGMTDEIEGPIDHLSSLIMLDECKYTRRRALITAQWNIRLDEMIRSPVSLDSALKILERFDQAEQDYHCKSTEIPRLTLAIKIIQRNAEFLTHCITPGQTGVDPEVLAAIDASTARDMLRSLTSRAAGDLGASTKVWAVWRDWEMTQLEHESERWVPPYWMALIGRASQVHRLHNMYLERLATPHLGK